MQLNGTSMFNGALEKLNACGKMLHMNWEQSWQDKFLRVWVCVNHGCGLLWNVLYSFVDMRMDQSSFGISRMVSSTQTCSRCA